MTKLRAVILAAGLGSRFGGDTPKCLAEINGKALLGHALEALAQVGYAEVAVVIGHRADVIRSWVDSSPLPLRVKLIFNPRFAEPSIHSVQSASEELVKGGILIESDLIFDPRIVADLLACPDGNVVCSTRPRNRKPFFVECDEERRVKRWGYAGFDSEQELVGIYRLSAAAIKEMGQMSGVEYWDPLLSLSTPLFCHECDYMWNEVDTPDELIDARKQWR